MKRVLLIAAATTLLFPNCGIKEPPPGAARAPAARAAARGGEETPKRTPAADAGNDEEFVFHREARKLWRDCSGACRPTRFDDFFNHRDFRARLEKAGQVSDVLEKLAKYRENFLKTGDFIELFPTLYFHTTDREFKNVLADRAARPLEKMEMMLRFYDAYIINRELFERGGAEAVEPHWKKYYRLAGAGNEAKNDNRLGRMTDTLLAGIEAHVDYDLPRLVRHITAGSAILKAELKIEFDRMDAVFEDAAGEISRDIARALGAPPSDSAGDKTFRFGAENVIYARKAAWELGAGAGNLPTEGPQPVFAHDPRSREFFPKELVRRGVCYKVSFKKSFRITEALDTGEALCENDRVSLRAGGSINLGEPPGNITPDGFRDSKSAAAGGTAFRQFPRGALIGVVAAAGGEKQILGAGSSWTKESGLSGQFHLTVNDKSAEDSRGAFDVDCTFEGYRLFKIE